MGLSTSITTHQISEQSLSISLGFIPLKKPNTTIPPFHLFIQQSYTVDKTLRPGPLEVVKCLLDAFSGMAFKYKHALWLFLGTFLRSHLADCPI